MGILPKLNDTPNYTMTIPSTGETIGYRPYLVKEEKVMLLQLDQSRIKSNLKFETSIPSGKRLGVFPHYYGQLELVAISNSWQLKKDAFELPIEILLQAESSAN